MATTRVPVALRSEDPELIEAVRSVLAVSSIPVSVYPETATFPANVGLVLDAAPASAPSWRSIGRRFARVGVRARHGDPDPDVLLLPHGAETLLNLARAANRVLRARVIGVTGSTGGVGASVFAAVLARVGAERGLASTLIEGGGGPSQQVLLNLGRSAGLRWADLGPSGMNPDQLTGVLPAWKGVRALVADDRLAPVLASAESIVSGLASASDLIVMDLQRHDVLHGVTMRWCDSVLLLSSCDLPAASATRALAGVLTGQDVRLVVRGSGRGGLHPSEVADACGLPLAVTMRAETSLPAGLERGVTPGDHRRGPLLRAARVVADGLGVGP